jgi:cell division septation protein DedD
MKALSHQWLWIAVSLLTPLLTVSCKSEVKTPPSSSSSVAQVVSSAMSPENPETDMISLQDALSAAPDSTQAATTGDSNQVTTEPQVAPVPQAVSSSAQNTVDNTQPIIRLETQNTSAKQVPKPTKTGAYVLQVMSSTNQAEIKKQLARLKSKGLPAYMTTLDNGSEPIYRIRIGAFPSPAEARQYGHAKLIPDGFDFWVDRKNNE